MHPLQPPTILATPLQSGDVQALVRTSAALETLVQLPPSTATEAANLAQLLEVLENRVAPSSMEPLTNSSALLHVKPPTTGSAGDARALLIDGRVVEARVVAMGTDGATTFQIGRDRLVATTNSQFAVGDQVQLVPERTADGEQVLRVVTSATEAPVWWGALREAMGKNRPLGEALAALATRIRATLDAPQPTALADLARSVSAHGFDPSDTSADSLRQLFSRGGGRLEANLLGALMGGADAERALNNVLGDLKGELLRALRDLPEGAIRDAVARALGSIEAEQWINVARQRSGESLVWSLPVPDAEAWSTARLWVDPERGGGEDEDGAPIPRSRRLSLSVRLTRTGPVRADVVATEERLLVRVLVERPELAERVRGDSETLTTILARGNRRVDLVVRVGTLLELAPEPADIEQLGGRSFTDFVA